MSTETIFHTGKNTQSKNMSMKMFANVSSNIK